MTVGDLIVNLGLNRQPLVDGLTKVTGMVQNFGKKLSGIVGGVSSVIGSIGGPLTAVAAALGAGAVVSAVTGFASSLSAMTMSAFEAVDSTAKLAASLGISANALVGIQHAASMSGVSLETLTAALRKAQLLRPGESFLMIARSIMAIPDPAKRARAAVDAFGKAGQQLLPIFNEGMEGLQALIMEGQKLRGFSPLDAAAVDAAGDAIDRIKGAILSIGQAAAIEVAPAVEKMSTVIRGLIPTADSLRPKLAFTVGLLRDVGITATMVTAALATKNVGFLTSLPGTIDAARTAFSSLSDTIGSMPTPPNLPEVFDAEGLTKRITQLRSELELLAAPEGMKQFILDSRELQEMISAGASSEQIHELGRVLALRQKITDQQQLANTEQQRMNSLADKLRGRLESLKSPLEVFGDAILEIREGLANGLIDKVQAGQLLSDALKTKNDAIKSDTSTQVASTGGGPQALRVGTAEGLAAITRAGIAQTEAKQRTAHEKKIEKQWETQIQLLRRIADKEALEIDEYNFTG